MAARRAERLLSYNGQLLPASLQGCLRASRAAEAGGTGGSDPHQVAYGVPNPVVNRVHNRG